MPKPEIALLHLYADLLNLYGENGNVKALSQTLRTAGHQVRVDTASIGDKYDIEAYDLVILGCGSEIKQLPALADLADHREEIARYLGRGGLLLATGNAMDLFGTHIVDVDGEVILALGLFDYHCQRLAEREVGEVLFKFADEYLIGFQNRGSRVVCQRQSVQALFEVQKGYATEFAGSVTVVFKDQVGVVGSSTPSPSPVSQTGNPEYEGLLIDGFLATSVLGLLTRNPRFLLWLVQGIEARKAAEQANDAKTEKSQVVLPPNRWKVPDFLRKESLESTTSAYVGYGLQPDIVAWRAFLANHHNI